MTTGDRFTYNTTANVGESYPSTVILYPYGGYYKADGSYVLDKTESTDETTTSGYSYGYSDDVKVGDKSYAVNIYSALLPIQITDVHFRFKTSLKICILLIFICLYICANFYIVEKTPFL